MATQNRDRFEILAYELAGGATVAQAMLAADYAPKTARQGRVQHNGRLVSPNNHPDVAARLADFRAVANGATAPGIAAGRRSPQPFRASHPQGACSGAAGDRQRTIAISGG